MTVSKYLVETEWLAENVESPNVRVFDCTVYAIPNPDPAGSVNVPFTSLHDPDTGTYLPIDRLRDQFEAVGVGDAERTITYCGSGVAASNDAFVLALLGYENISVYDGSLSEWGYDEKLPMDAD